MLYCGVSATQAMTWVTIFCLPSPLMCRSQVCRQLRLLMTFSCCLSLELCCLTASYSYIVLAHKHYWTCTTDRGNYVHHPPQARGLVQHGSRLLSPLPSSAQVPASRPRVLHGCSRRHIRERHIKGNGRWSMTDSVARMAESQ